MDQRVEHLIAVVRQRRTTVLVAADAVLLATVYVVTALLRYEDKVVPWTGVLVVTAVAITVHAAMCWLTKLYRGRAAIASTEETVLLGGIAALAALIVSVVNVWVLGHMVARTIPFAAGFTAGALMLLIRALWRRYVSAHGWRRTDETGRTVVVGAGDSGRQLISSMLGTPSSPYGPVALVDDDPWKRHLRHFGIPVKGGVADLETVVESTRAEVVVVAIPSAPRRLITDLTRRCGNLGVTIKVLPPVDEIFGARVSISDVRDIDVADLLGRSAIETDIESIAHTLNGKRILVTGAGGSIGSELARQIAKWRPAHLMMLDRDETGLHGVQLSISGKALLDTPDVILCDIRDAQAVQRVFEERRPDVVFHAAALKHLPMLEQYPDEAIKTNVIGSINVLRSARSVGVERFVNISTDKAADPTSVLGYSKRVVERITAHYATDGLGQTEYMSVRFGNVLGSRGSVLITFVSQIANGGPVTVTHPDVRRYFMTVREAVQLVLQAGAIGSAGEVMILDMGDPVRIDDVARELIRQSAREIDIVYTGLRDGEKLDEVLRTDLECDERPHHELISHVKVPPLAPGEVSAEEIPEQPDAARKMLQSWCMARIGIVEETRR